MAMQTAESRSGGRFSFGSAGWHRITGNPGIPPVRTSRKPAMRPSAQPLTRHHPMPLSLLPSPPLQLLLLEDDPDLGQAVADHLAAAGHQVCWCRSLAAARAAPAPDLALLDLHLPDGDGLDLLRAWRAAAQAWPVIVLTARDQVRDRIRGLQAGADDYLVKPFDLDELLARVAAVARRRPAPTAAAADLQHQASPDAGPHTSAAPPWRLDTDNRTVWRGADRLDLTRMEWSVLACLAQRRGRIYSRSEIESQLDGPGLADATSNSLEVIISRLRKKLGASAISTHRGLGYRLEH